MIPKVIHYCWFGRKPLPKYARKCIASWKKYLPDYEIREWNEDNFDVNMIPYTREAYKYGKYAFVSDYARYLALYQEGGVYFDTDVEIIRPIDDIINKGAFLGIEKDGELISIAPGLGMGAYAGMEFYRDMIEFYSDWRGYEGEIPNALLVSGTTNLLLAKGFLKEDRIQNIAGIWIYPNDYFNPMDDYTGEIRVTKNTRTIHYYAKSWIDGYSPLRNFLSKCFHRFKKCLISNIYMIKYYFKLFLYYIFKTHYFVTPWGSKGSQYHRISIDARNAKKVVFMCDGFKGHGGFTDRMKGCLTTYVEAKRHKLPFFINWTSPFNLDEFLVPSGECDWRIDPPEISYNYADSFPVIMDVSPTRGKNVIKKFIFKYCFIGKRDVLVYSNMMYVKKNRPKLYHELFKPSDYLQQHIDLHLNNIGTNYWAYTFRFGNYLGDFRDIIGYPLEETERMRLVNKNIEELKRMLENLPKGFKALVTSDSFFFLNYVEKVDKRIYIVKKELMHMDFYKKEDNKKEIWLKSFLDLYLIMRSQRVFLLKTEGMYKSSFPEFAALLGGKEFIYHEF